MWRIAGLAVLLLSAVEEVLFRVLQGKGLLPRACDDEESPCHGSARNLRIMTGIRWAQLLLLILILGYLVLEEYLLLHHTAGQLLMSATVLHLFRMAGRHVLRYWSVLGEVQVLQTLLLVLALLYPLDAAAPDDGSGGFRLFALGIMLFRALNAAALAFSLAYAGRTLSHEGGRGYHGHPPMAFSEYWAGRLNALSVPMGLVSLGVVLAKASYGTALTAFLGFAVLACVSTGLLLRSPRPHHPVAHVLIALAALALAGATHAGFAGG